MTREEAIEYGKMWLEFNEDGKDSRTYEFFELAVKFLEQEPCDDAVSRQVALNSLEELDWDTAYERSQVEEMLKSLPPVTPIRPKGEWKYDKTIQNWRCSKCHETPKTLGYVGTKEFMTEHFKFCNHCGADMRGEQE